LIDQRLYEKRTNGYRFENMPPDGEAHRLGLQAIQQVARELFGRDFLELTWLRQEEILLLIRDDQPKGAKRDLGMFAASPLLGFAD
jgi:gluconate 2-dehydrogenase gamma chain